MNTGISYQSIADGKYKVTENYLLSGPNGWNKKFTHDKGFWKFPTSAL